jgi:hypothetical protein
MNHRHNFHARIACVVLSCLVLFVCIGVLVANTHSGYALRTSSLGREFNLKVGESTTVKRTGLRIRFAAVENDSRCPSDVTCVWAGNAAVQLQLGTGKRSKTVTLNTSNSPSFVGEVEYQGYKVKLIGLSPYPRSDRKIAKRDYRATLLVSKQ